MSWGGLGKSSDWQQSVWTRFSCISASSPPLFPAPKLQEEVEARAERAGLIRHITRSSMRTAGSGSSGASAASQQPPPTLSEAVSAVSGSSGAPAALPAESSGFSSGAGAGPSAGGGRSNGSPSFRYGAPPAGAFASPRAAGPPTASPSKPVPPPEGGAGAPAGPRGSRRASGSDAFARSPAAPQLQRRSATAALSPRTPRGAAAAPARPSGSISLGGSPRAVEAGRTSGTLAGPTSGDDLAGHDSCCSSASIGGAGVGSGGPVFALGGHFLGLLPAGIQLHPHSRATSADAAPPLEVPQAQLAPRRSAGSALGLSTPGGLESIPSPVTSEHPSASSRKDSGGSGRGVGGVDAAAAPGAGAAAAGAGAEASVAVAAGADAAAAAAVSPPGATGSSLLGWLRPWSVAGRGSSGFFTGSSSNSLVACQASREGSAHSGAAPGPSLEPAPASAASSSRGGPGDSGSGLSARSGGKHVSFAS
jgi:hypothetical protein